MEYYNRYVNPLNNYKRASDSDLTRFESEIAFVRTDDEFKNNFHTFETYYITFKNGKQGNYIPHTKYKSIYEEYIKDKQLYLDKYKDIISDFQYVKRYYTYIYVVSDDVNPHLEGKILPYYYGKKIDSLIWANVESTFEKTFMINIRLSSGYPNYDRSNFTDYDFSIESKGLIINAPHPPICLATLDRTFKLKKIMNSIKTPQL